MSIDNIPHILELVDDGRQEPPWPRLPAIPDSPKRLVEVLGDTGPVLDAARWAVEVLDTLVEAPDSVVEALKDRPWWWKTLIPAPASWGTRKAIADGALEVRRRAVHQAVDVWVMYAALADETPFLRMGLPFRSQVNYWPVRGAKGWRLAQFWGWDDRPDALTDPVGLARAMERGVWLGTSGARPGDTTRDGLPMDWLPRVTDSPLMEWLRLRRLAVLLEEARAAGDRQVRRRLTRVRDGRDEIAPLVVPWAAEYLFQPLHQAVTEAAKTLREE